MRRYLTLACAGLVLMAVTSSAQHRTAKEQEFEIYRSNKSGMEFFASNYGVFGQSPFSGEPGLTYPRGSGRGYLFGSGLWFGGQKMVENELKKLVFVTYNPVTGKSWAMPGEYESHPDDAPSLIFNSIEYSHMTGEYLGQEERPRWPLWLRHGMRAQTMNPGRYEPVNELRAVGSDYSDPAMVEGVSEEFISRFHDSSLVRYEVLSPGERAGAPMGLQFQQNLYSFEHGLYESVVMVQYQIVNHSIDTLFNCIAGQFSDPDLGDLSNDYMRFVGEYADLRTAYIWTDNEGTGHGALAMSLIEAPMTDANGFVDNTMRHAYKTDGRAGGFPRWVADTAPIGFASRYDYMNSGVFSEDLGAGDQRALMASTKFSMRPGDTAFFTVAYTVLDSIPTAGKTRMKDSPRTASRVLRDDFQILLKALLNDYYDHGVFLAELPTGVESEPETGLTLTALPNPVYDRATIRLTLAEPADATLRITNSLGQTVMVRELGLRSAGTYNERIDAANLPPGLYFAMVEVAGKTTITRFVLAR